MRRRQYLGKCTAVTAAGLTGLSGCLDGLNSGSGSENEPVSLSMATFVEGTGWYVLGSAVADALPEYLPDGSDVSVLPEGGGIGSVELLREGVADFSLLVPPSATWARNAEHAFEGEDEYTDMRALIGHLDTYWMPIALRNDVPVSTIPEIKEEEYPLNLAIATAGSLGAIGVEQMFNAHDVTFDDIESWGGNIERMAFGDMVSAVQGGDMDGMGQVATPGHPTWTELSSSVDVKFIPHDDTTKNYLLERGWLDMPDMPEGEFGASEDIPTVGWRTGLSAGTDTPDYVARAIVEAVINEQDAIESAASSFEAFDPEEGAKDEWVQIPFHDAADEYLSEEGYR